MAQFTTKNIHAYCEPSPTTYVVLTFGFAHSLEGLAFVAYWGIVLFGYDTSAPHIPCVLSNERTDMGYAEALEGAS